MMLVYYIICSMDTDDLAYTDGLRKNSNFSLLTVGAKGAKKSYYFPQGLAIEATMQCIVDIFIKV